MKESCNSPDPRGFLETMLDLGARLPIAWVLDFSACDDATPIAIRLAMAIALSFTSTPFLR
ncbi:MAG: hypothetical protein EBY24_18735 [Betaproteobacteria bacterium]|nr:hypothetical protein [Betaproteobacteria bacterium]